MPLPRLVPAALALVLALGLLSSGRADAAEASGEGLQPGTPVPSFLLPVVHGSEARRFGPGKWTGSGAEQPKKLVILSFFATWCEPCKKEMPELVRLAEKYDEAGLGVMLVSIDKGMEQRDEVVKLAASHKVAFPVLHDRFQVVARRYDAERLPYMLLVGPDGVVKRAHVGYTEALQASLENEVRAELGLEPLPAAATDSKGTDDGKSTGKQQKTREQKGKGK